MRSVILCSILSAVVWTAGCDLFEQPEEQRSGTSPLVDSMTGLGVMQEMQGGSTPQSQQPTPENAESASPDAGETTENTTEETGQEPTTERVKAEVGAGKKGHYGKNESERATGIVTVPVSTLFRAQEMTVFRMQIPQALQLFKAMNDGKGPETHEEFMQKIVGENQIKLPDLPDGQKYVYDPEKEELMIEKPR